MNCLKDIEIQEVVDNEAADDVRLHAASCARCGGRVRERALRMSAIRDATTPDVDVPPRLARRIERALAEGPVRGATRLTEDARPVRRRAFWSGAAFAAAMLIAILFVAPMFRGPSTVSAAEILAKSATRLAERVTTGVEILEYELTLEGVPREMMPDHLDGAYRMKQVIDHDTPGRYFLATYGPDGRLVSSIAQDPAANRRVMTIRIDDQPYRLEFSLPESLALTPPEMERLHMEASVAMMQASGNQLLQVIDTNAGRQYRIEVPRVDADATTNAMWDLAEAKVLIDASDYHIVEFAVKGTFLKQPYSVSYRLIRRVIAEQGEVSAGDFAVPADARAIEMRGEGSAIPVRDALVVALRELAKARTAR
jgi:hypothetical protein